MGHEFETEEILVELYDEHGPAVYRFLLALTGRKEDAEDAMQNAFFKMARRGNRLAAVQDFKKYLYASARNEALSILRKRSRKEIKEIELQPELCLAPRTDSVEEDEERRIISQALLRLSPEQREVVGLHTFEELALQEISVLLGISVNTVKSRHRLGLKKLKRILKWRES